MYDMASRGPITTMLANYPNHVENGREYHGYRRGMYLYPCDQEEQNRMDCMHALFREARRKRLHEYPLVSYGEPPRVLDLGCGTGLWCMDMATEYPDAEIWGMDLANIQPEQILPNIRFRVPRDYESPWNLGEDSFDLIHLRLGCGSVSNWNEVYSSTFRHLKPRTGRFEQVEIDIEPRCDDGTLPENATIRRWYASMKQATEIFNRPIAYNHATPYMLAAQGFTDIEERVIRVPLQTWSRHPQERALARWNLAIWAEMDCLEAYSLGPLTRAPVSWPVDQVKRFCEETVREMNRRDYHIYHNMHIITARRP